MSGTEDMLPGERGALAVAIRFRLYHLGLVAKDPKQSSTDKTLAQEQAADLRSAAEILGFVVP